VNKKTREAQKVKKFERGWRDEKRATSAKRIGVDYLVFAHYSNRGLKSLPGISVVWCSGGVLLRDISAVLPLQVMGQRRSQEGREEVFPFDDQRNWSVDRQ